MKKRGHDPEHLRDYRANPVLILKRLKNIKWFKPFCAKAVAQFEMGRFIKDNIAVSTKGYISEKAMYKNCPKADCFIAGSDQIWRNPTGSRFLNYAPDEAIKLSYAASFGRTSLPKEIAEKIKPWLNRFDGISVREKTAVNMVESIVDKEVVQVLDPTLLLDMDEYPYTNIEEKNYCYCYFLNAVCLEGSLKLKEISYIHSEAYAAGELKHGTISLIEQGTLVIGVLTQSELYEKTISNMLECKSRGAYLMGLTTYGKYEIEDQVNFTVYVPKVDEHFVGSLAVIPLQLLGYYVSVAKGLDVDKPRNLAKSVTVE